MESSGTSNNATNTMVGPRSDSLRSVLSYYESNIASSQNSASKSFLANIASNPQSRNRRRLSVDGLVSMQQETAPEKHKVMPAPRRMSRRASWCSAVDTSAPITAPKSPRAEAANISKGTVNKTKALFEGMSSQHRQQTTERPRMGRRSSAGPGVPVGRQVEETVFANNHEHFQQMLNFWSTLPKPSPDHVGPRIPQRWNSMKPVPETVRDIALKAATPTCVCPVDVEEGEAASCPDKNAICRGSISRCSSICSSSICSSCGLDTTSDSVVETDDSSVVSSAMCVFDGSNLYLPLPQGCMVFRSASSAGVEPLDHKPKPPIRHGSMRKGSMRSLGRRFSSSRSLCSARSFYSLTSSSASIAQPRRVRIAEENNEVWFFEVDDLCSVFSEDGMELELDQDFASIFDVGNDKGPRQARRRGSGYGSTGSSVGSWEYVGFYDEVKLPQDFVSAFMEGKGDYVPRFQDRRGSLERKNSLLGKSNKDRAPQMTKRRGSMEMEDCSFDDSEPDLDFEHFVPSNHDSQMKRRGSREEILSPVREGLTSLLCSKSPMSSLFGTPSPDRAPKAICRRGSIENEVQSDALLELPSLAPLDKSPGPSCDASPRKANRRASLDTTDVPPPAFVGLSDVVSGSLLDVDATTESTDTTLRKATRNESLETNEMPLPPFSGYSDALSGKPLEIDAITVSTTGTHGDEEPIQPWKEMEDPFTAKEKLSRRATIGDVVPMSELTVKSAMRDCLQSRLDTARRLGQKGTKNRRASTGCKDMRPSTFRGLSFEDDKEQGQMMAQACTTMKTVSNGIESEEKDLTPRSKRRSKQGPFDEHGKVGQGLDRMYSLSDDDDCESIASQSSASTMSSQCSLRPASIRGDSFDSNSGSAKAFTKAIKQDSGRGNAGSSHSSHAFPYTVFFDETQRSQSSRNLPLLCFTQIQRDHSRISLQSSKSAD